MCVLTTNAKGPASSKVPWCASGSDTDLQTTSRGSHGQAEYCAPVWCGSPHASKVDVAINSALRIITRCLKPTPVSFLPVLTEIAPAGLQREAATLALAKGMICISDTTPQQQQCLQADSNPATPTTRQHKSYSIPPLRTSPEMLGWQQLGSGGQLGLLASIVTFRTQEVAPSEETTYHADNGQH
ncbi:LOW QUALITY PROTEIN: eukaryotic translation initiation factor 3 subunit E-B [Xyrichtys novacula]|uniref:LOW QUALITY PROTEIN: eukaryotic translation initiation factor 3 subunit E-B n=1 Tax=Xyrichtys novacula TaxID=13765 RepID=A0AAV1F0K9_XYRNO|nr:LOW QUALITY PROTEIN: eukaryotic translation initiation factor 3 subunit E-B [Xyrichtys novacula]